jgi:SAM-dependent methyltransferase
LRLGSASSLISGSLITTPLPCPHPSGISLADDESFDRIYPPAIRELSGGHWTPIAIARQAAEFLVTTPGTRVLDIGCGPGKFCLVGALITTGHFTGIEQRPHLATLARKKVEQAGLRQVEILAGNVLDLDLARYDAFYLFDPFADQLGETPLIDRTVPLSGESYRSYTAHVSRHLAAARVGTRVATYCGACEEIPPHYRCAGMSPNRELKLWIKSE